MPSQSVHDFGMKRRSALTSMMAAFTGAGVFTGESFTMAAKQPSGVALRPTTMIETRDGAWIHFRDWGAGAKRNCNDLSSASSVPLRVAAMTPESPSFACFLP